MQAPAGLVVPIALTAALVVGILVLARRGRTKARAELRSWWGRVPPGQPGACAAASLDALWGGDSRSSEAYRLDDRTWHDLDLDAVFERLDRCTSPIGSQVLYLTLRRPEPEPETAIARRTLADQLAGDADLRERVQLCLRHVRDPHAARVAEMLWRPLPHPPRLAALAPLLTAAALALPLLIWQGLASPVLLLGLFVVNTAVHFAHRRRIDDLPLAQLGGLVRAGTRAARLTDPRLHPLSSEAAPAAAATSRLGHRLAPLQADDGVGLLQYVKIYLLVDVIAYNAVVALVRRRLPELRRLFLALGRIDALLAVASFRVDHPGTCRPETVAGSAGAHVEGAWHPLVTAPVANDYRPEPRAALVTGSNMAGKTTFLKTIGVNAVLARAIDLACADAWVMPPLRVLTSIGRADNLIEGRSYYLAEVESILRLVRAANGDARHLFIADEVFRGTNPEERMAAGTAVLRHLARPPHLVLAATHDHEMVALLAAAYGCYHFAEALDEHGLSFDYRLRPGPATTRNAIALLEHMGYPPAVLDEARRLVRQHAPAANAVLSAERPEEP